MRTTLGAIALILLVAGVWIGIAKSSSAARATTVLQSRLSSATSYRERADAYTAYLRAVGPVAAQELFAKNATNTPRLHVVNHLTGQMLYKLYGPEAIQQCRPYLSYSCYHGFIDALMVDRGLADTESILRICANAGGNTETLQCQHGIGHGLVAILGYGHVPEALAACGSIFSESERSRGRCWDGVFMEYADNQLDFEPSKQLRTLLSLCQDPAVVATGAAKSCVTLLSKKLVYPSGELPAAVAICEALPQEFRSNCYWGIAWGLRQRDPAHPASGLVQCTEIPAAYRAQCRMDLASVAYFFGDRSEPVLGVCDTASERDACLSGSLFTMIQTVYTTRPEQLEACDAFQEASDRASCTNYMQTHAAFDDAEYRAVTIDAPDRASWSTSSAYYPALSD